MIAAVFETLNQLKATIVDYFSFGFSEEQDKPLEIHWQTQWSDFLNQNVSFYRELNAEDKEHFHHRVFMFLNTTAIECGYEQVEDGDRLLVAASAIIPVWSFPEWHYFNLKKVLLLPAAFNTEFQCGMADSCITGMVGTGPMDGLMALSKPALYQGFKNPKDKQNVGIHEFVHLIDMADGECDGYPERLKQSPHSIPWFELVHKKVNEIHQKRSNIREYGGTNRQEFFAVASEYFFERPDMLKKKHPQLYRELQEFYQQDRASIKKELNQSRNSLCACGSGKKFKRCCLLAEKS